MVAQKDTPEFGPGTVTGTGPETFPVPGTRLIIIIHNNVGGVVSLHAFNMDDFKEEFLSTLYNMSDQLREKAVELEDEFSPKALVDRGKKLQKNMKFKKKSPTAKSNNEIQISICKMILKGNNYRKDSPYTEVSLMKMDMYNEVVEKAAATLNIEDSCSNLALFRANGALIKDEPIMYAKVSCVWTIGRYLNKLHIAADKLHLGIGIHAHVC
jgi:hypothetical protein